jgi:hypothetical protein
MPDINQPLVSMLRRLVEDAEAGRIQSVAVAATGPDRLLGYGGLYSYSGDEQELNAVRAQLGALSWGIDQRLGGIMPNVRGVKFILRER